MSSHSLVKFNLPAEMWIYGGYSDAFNEAFFALKREIERPYEDLPWPKGHAFEVLFLTNVLAGRGDVSGAAKAVAVFQKTAPNAHIDWVLNGGKELDPASFLPKEFRDKVTVRFTPVDKRENKPPIDFVVLGPAIAYEHWRASKNASKASGRDASRAQYFYFVENCVQFNAGFLNKLSLRGTFEEEYPSLFPFGYPKGVTKGLYTGSGIMLNKALAKAPLSERFSCPSYLHQLEDEGLKQMLLKLSGKGFSINSGYCHFLWQRFIDVVTTHEREKSVAIVLNSKNYKQEHSTGTFKQLVFPGEKIQELHSKGFSKIYLNDGQATEIVSEEETEGRALVVLIRPHFSPSDMNHLQLASERLVTTGENTSAEGLCARAKLFLYEDVRNGGGTGQFLGQLVNEAKKISPKLSRLLALFGGADAFWVTPEKDELLKDPDLAENTLKFCQHVTSHFSFEEVFVRIIKRMAYSQVTEDLAQKEIAALPADVKKGVVSYFKNPRDMTLIFDRQGYAERLHHLIAGKQEPVRLQM